MTTRPAPERPDWLVAGAPVVVYVQRTYTRFDLMDDCRVNRVGTNVVAYFPGYILGEINSLDVPERVYTVGEEAIVDVPTKESASQVASYVVDATYGIIAATELRLQAERIECHAGGFQNRTVRGAVTAMATLLRRRADELDPFGCVT